MSDTVMPEPAPPTVPTFAQRDPHRWTRELDALAKADLSYDLLGSETPGLVVTWPPGVAQEQANGHADAAAPVPLLVFFHEDHPWFPPTVVDVGNRLRLSRHRTPRGILCLLRPDDWNPHLTVADLLTSQIPRLIAASFLLDPTPDMEAETPEPVSAQLPASSLFPALVIPEVQLPPADQGAFVTRLLPWNKDGAGTGLVEHLFADGFSHHHPLPPAEHHSHSVVLGRWTRDRDFDPSHSAQDTWERVTSRLADIELQLDDPEHLEHFAEPSPVDPTELEFLCLRIPSETRHRSRDEEWIGLVRVRTEAGYGHQFVRVQTLGPDIYRPRNHHDDLSSNRVAMVGVGAIGSVLTQHLAQAGVGRLDLIDGDYVDIATATRQHAPVTHAGRPKATAVAEHLRLLRPDLDIHDHVHYLGTPQLARHMAAHARTREALTHSDVLIDATASTTVTRYLAALRQRSHRSFVHVSATAGAWGGVVFAQGLSTDRSACWACLERHRLDRTVPRPPADPEGVIVPTGCAEATFTGTGADLATIAAHAARIIVGHLCGEKQTHNLHIAHLHDAQGRPVPAWWESATVAVHGACPYHRELAPNP